MAKTKKGTDGKKKIREGVNKAGHSMNPGKMHEKYLLKVKCLYFRPYSTLKNIVQSVIQKSTVSFVPKFCDKAPSYVLPVRKFQFDMAQSHIHVWWWGTCPLGQ